MVEGRVENEWWVGQECVVAGYDGVSGDGPRRLALG